MMCKLHDDDDESIVKTRTCIVASIVFQEFVFAIPPPPQNCPVNFKLRAVLTSLYDVQTS